MLWKQFIGFAILGLTLAQLHSVNSQAAVTTCKSPFALVSDKCLLWHSKFLNWYEADRQCRSQGAQLVSVQNVSQLQAINKWMKASSPNTVEFWTSGNKLGNTQNLYFWESTGQQAKYLPWAKSQPKPKDGDCLMLYSEIKNGVVANEYLLSVRNCTAWSSIVCEQVPTKSVQRTCLMPNSFETVQVQQN
ncbi:GH19784 [Drosophila grimshawi]|uniref:GH19784 n=1 Tax=Drosophila grimshawi TaxID=7222 RepID=B4J415_DROGR|nr:GH19784 [Drosophila grimshawi]